jgi:hypothetical protein
MVNAGVLRVTRMAGMISKEGMALSMVAGKISSKIFFLAFLYYFN